VKKSIIFKLAAIIVCIFMLGSLFVGCKDKDKEETGKDTKKESNTIQFWFWNADEGKTFKETVENETGLDVKLVITPNDDNNYVTKLETNIKAGTYFADVAAAEAGYVRRVIDMPKAFCDLTDSPFNGEDDIAKLVQYAADVAKDSDGVQRLVPTQATPCGIVYKRKLAAEYLGTDDPAAVGEMMQADKIVETAKKMKEASGGKAKLVSGIGVLLEIYLGGRQDPWVKDGKFYFDPSMDEFISIQKQLRDLDQDAALKDWDAPWSEAFLDDTTFCWASPPWFPTYIIKPKYVDNKLPTDDGSWAVCKGPRTSYWGGTYLGVLETSENKNNAWKFIRTITLDEEAVEKRITIGNGDPTDDDYQPPTPDFTSNMAVNQKLAADDKMIDKFLNQNFFQVYNELADGINGRLQTEYDDVIKETLQGQIELYLAGEKDLETMKADFIQAIKSPLQANGVKFD